MGWPSITSLVLATALSAAVPVTTKASYVYQEVNGIEYYLSANVNNRGSDITEVAFTYGMRNVTDDEKDLGSAVVPVGDGYRFKVLDENGKPVWNSNPTTIYPAFIDLRLPGHASTEKTVPWISPYPGSWRVDGEYRFISPRDGANTPLSTNFETPDADSGGLALVGVALLLLFNKYKGNNTKP